MLSWQDLADKNWLLLFCGLRLPLLFSLTAFHCLWWGFRLMAPTRLFENHCWKWASAAQPLWCIDNELFFPLISPLKKARGSQNDLWQQLVPPSEVEKNYLLLYLNYAQTEGWILNSTNENPEQFYNLLCDRFIWYYLVRSYRYIGDADRVSGSLNLNMETKIGWMTSDALEQFVTNLKCDAADSWVIMKPIRWRRERKGRLFYQITQVCLRHVILYSQQHWFKV